MVKLITDDGHSRGGMSKPKHVRLYSQTVYLLVCMSSDEKMRGFWREAGSPNTDRLPHIYRVIINQIPMLHVCTNLSEILVLIMIPGLVARGAMKM